jgi:hypothetical protein
MAMKLVLVLLLTSCAALTLFSARPQSTASPSSATFSDPVTLSQVRELFRVLGFSDTTPLHRALEIERKKLPPWYPPAIWDEIEHAIESTDRAQIALPVYQKYLSRGEAQLLLNFYTSPAGNALTQKLLAQSAASRAAGSSPLQAHADATQSLSENDVRKADEAWSKVSSEEKRQAEFFLDSGDYKHFIQSVGPVSAEYAQLFRVRQRQIIDSVSEEHGGDLTNARASYKKTHPDLPSAPN